MKSVDIYTDGGCSGNPGPGGWAFAVRTADNTTVTASGGAAMTTNNQMELTAVIEALASLSRQTSEPTRLIVHTDSQYVKNGITVWIHGWLRNGWRTAAGKPVKNVEYWKRLKELADAALVEWKWVPGHAGVELNELCDALVQTEIAKYRD